MSKLSQRISEIMGFHIKEGEWQKHLTALDVEGEPTRKHIGEMLFALAEDQEELRRDIDAVLLKDKYVKTTPNKRNSD